MTEPKVCRGSWCMAFGFDPPATLEQVAQVLSAFGYDGMLAPEYVWIDWERCNECDNISETILMRDRLQAAIDGRAWSYPVSTT